MISSTDIHSGPSEDSEDRDFLKENLSMDTASPLPPGVFDSAARANPKDSVGSKKLPLHLWPSSATAMGSIAMLNGALKYGRSNWRSTGVRASVYYSACNRHMNAWFEGEDSDEEGVPHLASALACIAIIIDSQAAGKLSDDRQYPGQYQSVVANLTPHVARLIERHSQMHPVDHTMISTGGGGETVPAYSGSPPPVV